MKILFKYVSSGLSMFLFYAISIFVVPIIMIFLDKRDFQSCPSLFGFKLYDIQMTNGNFVSEATAFGALLSFSIGIALYFLISLFINKGKVTNTA
ncbi:hypothetical protein [Bacillus sp. FJAT-47783]|uniref:hypothetical protein n=1 Tax=Bacillus sp. FJAT-47783 TaxID=2922712 RepID=UPI001FAD88CB|nr:hypothetical protein [Bacillus sp. FJAT-47783]